MFLFLYNLVPILTKYHGCPITHVTCIWYVRRLGLFKNNLDTFNAIADIGIIKSATTCDKKNRYVHLRNSLSR